MTNKQQLWDQQTQAWRDPIEVVSGQLQDHGLNQCSLQFKADRGFGEVLAKLEITLLVTREYEHLVLAFNAANNQIKQSFSHLPHPSGLVVNRQNNAVYVAATRNPNQIWEFMPDQYGFLMPTRSKFYPGRYYFHELAFINDKLYGNSVGQNAVVKINLNLSKPEAPVWWPKCIENAKGEPDLSANYLQLNSIAAGNSLIDSYFCASTDRVGARRPGHRNFSVDKMGVIFSGKTRGVVASGLTRPHSLRFHKNKLWLDNSGYGEVGYIENSRFRPVFKLPGWTRGLCFVEDIMFVGVSRVLPRFTMYAPGLNFKQQICGIFAVDALKAKIVGSLIFPYGNQIFALDYLPTKTSQGFFFKRIGQNQSTIIQKFYRYQI